MDSLPSTSTSTTMREAQELHTEAQGIRADMLARFALLPPACRPSPPPPPTSSTPEDDEDVYDELNVDSQLRDDPDTPMHIGIEIDVGPSSRTPQTPPTCAQPIPTASTPRIPTPDAPRRTEPDHDEWSGFGWQEDHEHGWNYEGERRDYSAQGWDDDGPDRVPHQSQAYSFGVGPSGRPFTPTPSPTPSISKTYGEFSEEEFEIAHIHATTPTLQDTTRTRPRRLRDPRDKAGPHACIRCRQHNIVCVVGPHARCVGCEKGKVACSRTWGIQPWETAIAVRGQLLLLARLETELRRRTRGESDNDGAESDDIIESETDLRTKTTLALLPRAGIAAARFLSLNFAPAMGLKAGDWYVNLFASAQQQREEIM